MSIIESLRQWLLTCPLLTDLSRLGVDFLPQDPSTYSVEQVPAQPILRQYLDGSSERQFVFVFASRMHYSDELRNNLENSGFYESFADWLEQQTDAENLPEMAAGKTPTRIEATSNGYLFDVSGNFTNARYQIQCRLIYDQEKG